MTVRDPMVPVSVAVRAKRMDCPGVATLELAPPDAAPFAFRPGQFNMLYAFGIGEIPVSITSDPAREGALIHTIRAVGAVSRALVEAEPGDAIGLRGPFGSAWPVEAARGRDVLVIAGGLGLPPVWPILDAIAKARSDYGTVTLLYGTRTPETILYPDALATAARDWDIDVRLTVDQAPHGWTGNVGVVTDLMSTATFDPGATTVFMCGPEIMMRFAVRAAFDAGIPEESIFVSLERNMKCAVRHCGRCQLGPVFVCRDGPVFPLPRVWPVLTIEEI